MNVVETKPRTIPFSIPAMSGFELDNVKEVFRAGKFSGNGKFANACQAWFADFYGTSGALMTPSCTQALEMAALLGRIAPGDEVILPSFTFTSTATAFVRCGATLVFVDINPKTMNIDPDCIRQAITGRTKAIAVMDYAGVACEFDELAEIASSHGLFLVEDAAQGLLASYYGRLCGTLGDVGTISFHETKNIHCGDGGCLIVQDEALFERAEIIQEKGTDRCRFLRGEVDKYTWQDTGSSFLLSELNAAFLSAQLEHAKDIIADRLRSWTRYQEYLTPLARAGIIELPHVPEYCTHNGHIFYIKTKNRKDREDLTSFLKARSIHATFHYVPLHSAPAGRMFGRFVGEDRWTTVEGERLLRLPLYSGMTEEDTAIVAAAIEDYYSA